MHFITFKLVSSSLGCIQYAQRRLYTSGGDNAVFTVTRYWQALLIRLLAYGQQRLANAITSCGAILQRWSQSSSTLTAFWWAPAPWIQLPDSTILLQVDLIWFFPFFNVFHWYMYMWYVTKLHLLTTLNL